MSDLAMKITHFFTFEIVFKYIQAYILFQMFFEKSITKHNFKFV